MAMPVGGLARFEHCSFRDVRIKSWYAFTVELIDCTFSGELRGGFFNGTPLEEQQNGGDVRNEFHGNDFSQMDLIDVGFRTGIDLTRQNLPVGPHYLYLENAAEVLRLARREIVGWTDLELRQPALRLLQSDEDAVAKGQVQLFFDLREPRKSVRSTYSALTDAYKRALKNIET